MFLRGPVPIHLKSVVVYHKNLGECQFFLAKYCSQPHGFRAHTRDVSHEYAKATPSLLEVSRTAFLLLSWPDSWVPWQILNAFPGVN